MFRLSTSWYINFSLSLIAILLIVACQGPPPPVPPPTPEFDPDIIDGVPKPEVTLIGVNGLNGPKECYGNGSIECGNNQVAEALGITWDRWPVQWFWVEEPGFEGRPRGEFHWEGVSNVTGDEFDIVKAANQNQNHPTSKINTLVILNGIVRTYDCIHEYLAPGPNGELQPEHFKVRTECDISNEDGNGDGQPDYPRIKGLFSPVVTEAGQINPENRWGNYVYETIKILY